MNTSDIFDHTKNLITTYVEKNNIKKIPKSFMSQNIMILKSRSSVANRFGVQEKVNEKQENPAKL